MLAEENSETNVADFKQVGVYLLLFIVILYKNAFVFRFVIIIVDLGTNEFKQKLVRSLKVHNVWTKIYR